MFAQDPREGIEPHLGGIFAGKLPFGEARAEHLGRFLQVFRFGGERIERAFILRAAKIDFAEFRKVRSERRC